MFEEWVSYIQLLGIIFFDCAMRDLTKLRIGVNHHLRIQPDQNIRTNFSF